jgi:hypothetical protein
VKSILRTIKRYWWGVFLTLLGAYLIVGTVFGLIKLIVQGDSSLFGLEVSRLVVNWGWMLFATFVWLIAGASALGTGISKVKKNLKAAREERKT